MSDTAAGRTGPPRGTPVSSPRPPHRPAPDARDTCEPNMTDSARIERPVQASAARLRIALLEVEPARVIAHLWAGARLYEVNYERAPSDHGRTRLIPVRGSERRCHCPRRAEIERARRAAVAGPRPLDIAGAAPASTAR